MRWSQDPGRVAPYLEEMAERLAGRGLDARVERTEPVHEFATLVVNDPERGRIVELDLFADGTGALITEDRLSAGLDATSALERVTRLVDGPPPGTECAPDATRTHRRHIQSHGAASENCAKIGV